MTQGGVGISTSETDGRTHSYAGAGLGSGHMKAAERPGGALFWVYKVNAKLCSESQALDDK